MWNLKKKNATNDLNKTEMSHRHRKLMVTRGERGVQINWEIGIDTLL